MCSRFSNLFTVHTDMTNSNASNYLVVYVQVLFVIEKIDNSISYHASQVLSFLVGLSDT